MKHVSCNSEGIAQTLQSFRHGGIIIFPTDTIYGIGCNPYNEESVERFIKLKNEKRENRYQF